MVLPLRHTDKLTQIIVPCSRGSGNPLHRNPTQTGSRLGFRGPGCYDGMEEEKWVSGVPPEALLGASGSTFWVPRAIFLVPGRVFLGPLDICFNVYDFLSTCANLYQFL